MYFTGNAKIQLLFSYGVNTQLVATVPPAWSPLASMDFYMYYRSGGPSFYGCCSLITHKSQWDCEYLHEDVLCHPIHEGKILQVIYLYHECCLFCLEQTNFGILRMVLGSTQSNNTRLFFGRYIFGWFSISPTTHLSSQLWFWCFKHLATPYGCHPVYCNTPWNVTGAIAEYWPTA